MWWAWPHAHWTCCTKPELLEHLSSFNPMLVPVWDWFGKRLAFSCLTKSSSVPDCWVGRGKILFIYREAMGGDILPSPHTSLTGLGTTSPALPGKLLKDTGKVVAAMPVWRIRASAPKGWMIPAFPFWWYSTIWCTSSGRVSSPPI